MSDSHDNTENTSKVVQIANKMGCELLLHLGDISSPFCAERLSAFDGDVKAVYGNCDGEVIGLQRMFSSFGGEIHKPPLELEISDRRMVLLHEPFLLEDLVYSGTIDYIFYGHLHTADLRQVQDTYILNPGETGGWLHHQPTFYIINTDLNHFDKIDI